jgi:hypothetical protein
MTSFDCHASKMAILLLQTLAEFANVAIRKAGIPIEDIRRTIDAWRAVIPIQAADDDDLAAALEAVDCRSGTRCCGLRRNVPACGACSLKICKMGPSCRASDSSTHSNEQMIGHLEKLLSLPIACGRGVNINESERERSGIICRQFCGVK